MSFGSCCFVDGQRYSQMQTRSVDIKGEQLGLLFNFEVIQTFYHNESSPKEVSYILPNDLKICIYETTFVIGEEIIKAKLEAKEEAKKTYEEAVEKGHTAIYGSNLRDGVTLFKLGNLPPNTDCKVILKIAFTGNMTMENIFFIKFPLDVCTPSGSRCCLDIDSSNFEFSLQCDKEKIKNVTTNVRNGEYDNSTKLFTIKNRVENRDNEHSIIINFETNEKVQSSVFIGESTENYDTCSLIISPNIESNISKSEMEYIFLIDCSGSMCGDSILKAAECLELFIRSLPVNSYFNIIRFGSSYKKLFESAVPYNQSNIEKALNLSQKLKANLGGTEIYSPLRDIYSQPSKFVQRQIFIMTDGEFWGSSEIIELVSSSSKENRCFTIGIGRGCDAGVIEKIAKVSGGKSDFVQEGDSISEKVIPQLDSATCGILNSIEIHIEGEENDAFQISPYPLPILSANGSCVVYLRSQKKDKNIFENGFLITADFGGETIEIPIEENKKCEKIEEDKYGCSNGKNIGKALLPLFAFNLLQKYEKQYSISEEERKNAIELSLSSGVLCKYTAYVGISEKPSLQLSYDDGNDNGDEYDNGEANYCKSCKKGKGKMKKRCKKLSKSKCKIKCSMHGNESYNLQECCNLEECRQKEECKEKECCLEERFRKEECCLEEERRKEEECLKQECCEAEECCLKEDKCCLVEKYRIEEEPCDNEEENCDNDANEAIKFESNDASDNDITIPQSEEKNEKKISTKPIDLMHLLRLQNFNGCWENLDDINSMLNVDVSKIKIANISDEMVMVNCIATILAIAALHIKFNDQKNLWRMIEKKAIQYLKSYIKIEEINQLIQDTESLI